MLVTAMPMRMMGTAPHDIALEGRARWPRTRTNAAELLPHQICRRRKSILKTRRLYIDGAAQRRYRYDKPTMTGE